MRIKQSLSCLVVFSIAILLNACTGMSGEFGCRASATTSCTPVSVVNAKASAGDYRHEQSAQQSLPLPYSHRFSHVAESAGYQGITPSPGTPVRAQARIQRIWIAPYQDLHHNYHEPSYIYTVLTPAHWLGHPVNAIKNINEDDQ